MATPKLTDDVLRETLRVLGLNHGNQVAAALALGISRGALQQRMLAADKRDIDDPGDPDLVKLCKDVGLRSFATVRQGEIADAVAEHGSVVKAARELGITRSDVQRTVDLLRKRASVRGYSPGHGWTRAVPDTHVAKGVSTYYNEDGVIKGQWVKADINRQAVYEAAKAAAAALAEEITPVDATSAPAHANESLLNVFTMTDCHVGMLAWGKETGEPWDLQIAERVLGGCFVEMVRAAPAAKVAYINQLGDFLHSDGMQAMTPTSGHLLDQDGRFAKVVRVAVRVLRGLVDAALARHEKVYVLLAEGNHDMASSIWLRAMFQALYEREPRVHVIDSEWPYYAHQHGQTMIAFHHGHLKKNDQLPLLFAEAFAPIWGSTRKRYCHTGHRHHVEEKEHSGMVVFQHPTLAAKDAYAARGGWMAMRRATAVTYHDRYGEVSRHTVCPEMLEAA